MNNISFDIDIQNMKERNGDEENENKNIDKMNSEVVLQSSKLKYLFCFLGCLTLCGLRTSIVRKMAFSPPSLKGYLVENNKFVCNHVKSIEFYEAVRRNNIGINFILIKKHLNKIASILIYRKPLNFNKQIILFSHGNSTDIGHMCLFFLNLVLYNDVNILAYDYSGYGYSNKKPSEKNIYKNIKIVYKHLIKELKINPLNIIVYGHSIGTACSCYLISLKKVQVGGCILQSPLASGLRLLIPYENQKLPWFDVFKNVDRLKKVSLLPIFLMHGKRDKQVPFNHAVCLMNILKENFEKRNLKNNSLKNFEEKKNLDNLSLINFWAIEDADHNDIEEKNTVVFYHKIKEFLLLCENFNKNKKS
ncbi:alpha/beta hydrolase fold domain containing protein, putative [Plasmodium gallinaceum]|uniref:Alpha/beta hydrolase fold domain containing protein, putative n=1 Tax=Plasmodium gallinaceum TaxID=5849 RepID=A0A1J1GVD3_PLAGA|nr:alpha/beta hydrolase fold domain containing protein, putative [Plasmodium gallinaceum]CRG96252.1 alpha/beta hydrolase fold domain containing protein, putative [Plasmodium gallinaceum]